LLQWFAKTVIRENVHQIGGSSGRNSNCNNQSASEKEKDSALKKEKEKYFTKLQPERKE